MKFFQQQFIFYVGFALVAGLVGCSKGDPNPSEPIGPVNPPVNTVPLTRFEVLLGDQVTSTANTRSDLETFNQPKTAFAPSDHFTFHYSNPTQASQKAYAYMSDGITWTVHELEEANSPVKMIQLDIKAPALSATYLSAAAIKAGADKDGIVTTPGTGNEVQIGCFDALNATAKVTLSNNKATAQVLFKHINHLLNIYVRGTISEDLIDHLELKIMYADASNIQQSGLLNTYSRASYVDTQGTPHTVFQAIVPHGAEIKDLRAVIPGGSVITTQGNISVDCPGGKSRLLTLNINDAVMTVQTGVLIDDWVFGGEMNPDGSPVGNIYIATADELRKFSEAVNINPTKSPASINGVLAYTAHVVQTADIDLSSLAWRPIGGNLYQNDDGDDEVAYFAGTYNGNGYTISGMKVTKGTISGYSIASYAGMFGKVQSPVEGYAILTNIHLINVDIQVNDPIDEARGGALAGYVYSPQGQKHVVISQCSAQGVIDMNNSSGRLTVGGLVGEAVRTHITGSSSDVSVVVNGTTASYAGGIVGRLLDASIASSYAKQSVAGGSSSGAFSVGGVAGTLSSLNESCYLLACRADGDVTSSSNGADAGGVVGYNSGIITGCYAKVNVTATGANSKSGAIMGAGDSSAINLCYGTGAVGMGTSNLVSKKNNVVYNVNPLANDILSIVSGKAWKEAADSEMPQATVGGILTTIPIYTGTTVVQEVKSRLWVLSDAKVWTTVSPASAIYPLPAGEYKGQ